MIFTTPRDENKSELKIKPRISVTDDIEDLQIEAGFLTVESESNYSQKMQKVDQTTMTEKTDEGSITEVAPQSKSNNEIGTSTENFFLSKGV